MNEGLGFLEDYDYLEEYFESGSGGGGDGFDFSEDYYGGGGNYGGYGNYGYYSDQLNFDDLYGGGYSPSINYAPYEPMPIDDFSLPTFPTDPWYVDPGYSPTQPQSDWQSYYQSLDYDPVEVAAIIQTREPENLPIVGDYWNVPYQSYLPTFETPPYTPYEPPAPEPPPLPPSPASQQPNLPPACKTGEYHPFPLGHQRQNECVPFPSAQTQTPSKPKPQTSPGSGSSGGSSGGSKPPAQQQCSSGQCKHPMTGQCIPIPQGYSRHPQTQVCTPATQAQTGCPTGYCRHPQTGQWIATPAGYYCNPQNQVCTPRCTTPGTVFDQAKGRCVPRAQATSPIPGSQPEGEELPEGVEDLFDQLGKLPWWVWAALAGVVVLNSKDDTGSPARRRSYR